MARIAEIFPWPYQFLFMILEVNIQWTSRMARLAYYVTAERDFRVPYIDSNIAV